jgi:hypothetical protein
MVAFDASIDDACNSKDVRCVSPSVLSKMLYSLVGIKINKKTQITILLWFC